MEDVNQTNDAFLLVTAEKEESYSTGNFPSDDSSASKFLNDDNVIHPISDSGNCK